MEIYWNFVEEDEERVERVGKQNLMSTAAYCDAWKGLFENSCNHKSSLFLDANSSAAVAAAAQETHESVVFSS